MQKIKVLNKEIALYSRRKEDYICITDIARYKDADRTDYIIQNWLRNRNTIEFLGIWERLNNPDFKPIEFDGFRKQAGLNSFTMTAKDWRRANPDKKGNIRDYANVSQLVCLSNMENLNALFIKEGISQSERLIKLNQIAIHQMKLLTKDLSIKKLERGSK
jgi:hypothetical protein